MTSEISFNGQKWIYEGDKGERTFQAFAMA